MATLVAGEDLEVLKEGVGELDTGAPSSSVKERNLHARPERLHDRVVQGGGLPTCCHLARARWRLAHNDAYAPGFRTRMPTAGFSAV